MQNINSSTYNAIRLWNRRSIGKESAVFKNYLRELCSMDMFLLHYIEKLAQAAEPSTTMRHSTSMNLTLPPTTPWKTSET